MTSLPSLHDSAAPTTLTGPGNFPAWLKNTRHTLQISHGAIGHNILAFLNTGKPSFILLRNDPPIHEPSELDPRVNPHNKQIIEGTLKYPREAPTPVDPDLVKPEEIFAAPLTAAGHSAFVRDTTKYENDVRAHNTELDALRLVDDACYAALLGTISSPAQAIIATNEHHKTLNNNVRYYYRSRDYLALVIQQFSTGDSFLATQNLLALLNTPQGPTTFSTYLDDLENKWPLVASSLEDPTTPGYVKLDCIKFIAILHTLDKDSASNKQAVNNYFTAHPSTNNIDSAALITELTKQNLGSLSAFSNSSNASDQTTALFSHSHAKIAGKTTRRPTPYGAKQAGRSDHCTFCFTNTKRKTKIIDGTTFTGPFYFYHNPNLCHRRLAERPDSTSSSVTSALAAQADTYNQQELLMAILANQQYDQEQRASDNLSTMSALTKQP